MEMKNGNEKREKPKQQPLFDQQIGGPTRRAHRERLRAELLPKRRPAGAQSAPKPIVTEQPELPIEAK